MDTVRRPSPAPSLSKKKRPLYSVCAVASAMGVVLPSACKIAIPLTDDGSSYCGHGRKHARPPHCPQTPRPVACPPIKCSPLCYGRKKERARHQSDGSLDGRVEKEKPGARYRRETHARSQPKSDTDDPTNLALCGHVSGPCRRHRRTWVAGPRPAHVPPFSPLMATAWCTDCAAPAPTALCATVRHEMPFAARRPFYAALA